MDRIVLRNTSLESSVLGFGCVSLTTHSTRKQALAMLELVLENGITHFDVARSYGVGQAEGILGEFLRGKRDRVTVTTKFGLEPPAGSARYRRLFGIARKAVRVVPGLKSLIVRRVRLVEPAPFLPQKASRSLETSLRELGTDHIDVFLLHEATLGDASQPELLGFLEEQVAKGTIRYYGIGAGFGKYPEDAALLPTGLKVLQFDHSPVAPNIDRLRSAQSRALITFGTVACAKHVMAQARARPELTRRRSAEVGADLSDRAVVASLLLRWAVTANVGGIALFATTKRQNLLSNLQHFSSRRYTTAQLSAFTKFCREVAVRPAPGT